MMVDSLYPRLDSQGELQAEPRTQLLSQRWGDQG